MCRALSGWSANTASSTKGAWAERQRIRIRRACQSQFCAFLGYRFHSALKCDRVERLEICCHATATTMPSIGFVIIPLLVMPTSSLAATTMSNALPESFPSAVEIGLPMARSRHVVGAPLGQLLTHGGHVQATCVPLGQAVSRSAPIRVRTTLETRTKGPYK
jgi:hypothetical protein